VELLKEAAQLLEKQKKRNEALQLLADAAEIDPFDAELRVRLAREFLELGQPKRARAYLSFETAGDDPELLLALATVEFAEGKEEDARVAMARVLALAPDREPEIARIAHSLMEESRVESAFACMDAITDAALLQGDVPRAAASLQAFVDRTPYIPALAKLVGISVEAGLGDRLRDTQAQLVDAYLEASRGEDARIVAEDLVRAEPANEMYAARLRRALTLTGESDPEAAVARIRSSQERSTVDPAPRVDAFDIDATMTEAEQPSEVPDPPVVSDEDEALAVPLAEIDLSTALSGLASPAAVGDASEAVLSASDPAADIEDVFAQMRAQSARDQQASAALAQYEEGARLIEQGLDREAIAALEAAARVPMMRFKAAARLGRFLIDRGDLNEGVEWLERAAEAPPPSPEEGHDLLYELAGALEAQGESARALAVLMELDAEADGYRDVRTRIMYLSRAQQAESHRS
jgi:tetratricopeptide (TPR) repeat protein